MKGSKGQIRVHPLADLIFKLETAIRHLEAEIGATPMARARLGSRPQRPTCSRRS